MSRNPEETEAQLIERERIKTLASEESTPKRGAVVSFDKNFVYFSRK